MALKDDKSCLGYLGAAYQYNLVKSFIEDKEFFKSLNEIIDQNAFTEPVLKHVVAIMRNHYNKYGSVPGYDLIGIELRDSAHTEHDREANMAVLERMKNANLEAPDLIMSKGEKFFKQQNLVKAANTILQIAGNGDVGKYDECKDILDTALKAGRRDRKLYRVFDDYEDTLAADYRSPIPTGIGKLDETLEGGLGAGELACIIGPSGFGKAQPVSEIVATPKGWTRMGDIKVGDYVIGSNGHPTKVIGVFPQGVRPIYRVEFSDGSQCRCDEEHLWNVNTKCNLQAGNEQFETVTLKELKGRLDNDEFYIPRHQMLQDCACFNHIDAGLTLATVFTALIGRYKTYQTGRVYTEKLLSDVGVELEKEIVNLIRSLGGYACIHDGANGGRKLTYAFECDTIETKRFITSVEYCGEEEAQCIKVDAQDELYLTRDYIVTHNTTVTTAIASTAATTLTDANNYKGYKVLQVVFEDNPKQMRRKHMSRIAQTEARCLSHEGCIERVRELTNPKLQNNQYIQDNIIIVKYASGEHTVGDIANLVKELTNEGFKPDVLIVDYFECLKLERGFDNDKWDAEGKTMRKLESITGELGLATWVTTQGTKESLNVDIVTLDKAGGSFKKVQIAHIVVSISRTLEDIDNNIAKMTILKNRAGKSGKTFDNVYFNNGTCTINTDTCTEFNSIIDYGREQKQTKEAMVAEIFKNAKAQRKASQQIGARVDEEF